MSNPRPSPAHAHDAVSRTVLHAQFDADCYPVPLIACAYTITIAGGLADVAVRRTFRNEEVQSIEATLTFPLPVDAVLYSLEARIAGRLLKGVAQARSKARETYEDAIDRGKATVLHEELLKGIHMLSVGQVAPGADIEVTVRFAQALAWVGGRARLRLPTTVGDVYGDSGLCEADDLQSGGTVLAATVSVTSDSGTPVLLGARLKDGAARVPLDRPITIAVEGWTPRAVEGQSADHRSVSLLIEPSAVGEAPIDAAILVDRSGSMAESCGGTSALTKHAAVLLGLNEVAPDLRDADKLALWQFDYLPAKLGAAGRDNWRELIHSLAAPRGGTEIGASVQKVLASGSRDVLLITDGKSHALDVQELAASGARFTVVLIGADSLEANVGHLAIVSGGQVFVGDGEHVAGAVAAAVRSLRVPPALDETDEIETGKVTVTRAGMAVFGSWGEPEQEAQASSASRPAAAYAASLLLPRLDERAAAVLAEAEGIVTHLTSLVLVDEAGGTADTIPVMRKVALPRPAAPAVMYCAAPPPVVRSIAAAAPKSAVPAASDVQAARMRFVRGGTGNLRDDPNERLANWRKLLGRVDWSTDGAQLAGGMKQGMPPDWVDACAALENETEIELVAMRARIAAWQLVIGLLAHIEGAKDRHAARVARQLLAAFTSERIEELIRHWGLRS